MSHCIMYNDPADCDKATCEGCELKDSKSVVLEDFITIAPPVLNKICNNYTEDGTCDSCSSNPCDLLKNYAPCSDCHGAPEVHGWCDCGFAKDVQKKIDDERALDRVCMVCGKQSNQESCCTQVTGFMADMPKLETILACPIVEETGVCIGGECDGCPDDEEKESTMIIKSIEIDERSALQYANQYPQLRIKSVSRPTEHTDAVHKVGGQTWVVRDYGSDVIGFAAYSDRNKAGAMCDAVDGVTYSGGWSSRPAVFNKLDFVTEPVMSIVIDLVMYYIPIRAVRELLANHGMDSEWDVFGIEFSGEIDPVVLPKDKSRWASYPAVNQSYVTVRDL
jgi:hypothetical protein